MDKTQLIDRISKKEEQIKKIEKRVTKWSKGLTDKDLEMAQLPFTKENNAFIREYKMLEYVEPEYDHFYCALDELRSANSDLEDAKLTLAKYKNQLTLLLEKESQEKIPQLIEFFRRYKEQIIQFVENNMPDLIEYFEVSDKYFDWRYNKIRIMSENNLTDEEYLKEMSKLRQLKSDLEDNIHSITRRVYSKKFDDHINRDELNDILDKDIENKYWNMVNKVTKITGEIVDTSNISIGGDGNLNGIIIGKDGKAKLETILAGGYNHNVIVNVRKGQILHYRLIVSKVR